MKDLEKIKSEDLGCQVQDANPGNFAIEQEVAQLVGATVPAPTEPSADDARELGAQLLVFLRRALLPIRSALRTAVAAIYAHLDSRCTDYTPAAYAPYQPLPSYDPMGTPPTPRTLPNLLTALTAFSDRKISNGSAPSDGIPDGTSLVHLLCGAYDAVTILRDDNHGWAFTKAMPNQFPNCNEYHFNCSSVPGGNITLFSKADADVHLDELETSNNDGTYYAMFVVKRLYLNAYKKGIFRIGGHAAYTNTTTEYIYVGCKGGPTDVIRLNNYCYGGGCTLAKVQLREGARQPFTLDCPSFQVADPYVNMTAENIVSGILEPLADNTDGSPITINIGSANLAKLTDEQKAIAQNKNYTLA